MKLHSLAIASLILATASLAHAGKAERDFLASNVEPAVKSAGQTLKKSCGCDVRIDLKADSFQTVDHLRQASHAANSITEKAPGYCTDAPSKAAICKLKTLEIARTGSAQFTFAAGKGSIGTDDSSFPHWDMISAVLDK